MTVIVMLAARRNQVDGLSRTPNDLKLGIPAEERAGVPQRRIAYSHPFDPDDLNWVVARVDPTITIHEQLPGDWRYSDEAGGTA